MASKTNFKQNCAVCKRLISNRQYLKCSICAEHYDICCIKNLSEQMFRLMTSKTKDKWRCPTCIKIDVKRVTPSSSTSRRIELQATDLTDSIRDDINKTERNKYNTKDDNDYVTTRKKFVINVSTENSFQSLSDEEILSSSPMRSAEESKLNRSCPERTLNTKYEIEEKNKIINSLENKLGSAEQEIDNLLLENSSLKKIIIEYEQKIRCLNEICKSPSATAKKNKNRLSNTAALTSTPKHFVKPIHDILPNAPGNPHRAKAILNHTNDIENTLITPPGREQNDNTHQQSPRTKIVENSARHKILLLADETGRQLRGRLQTILGDNYHITAIIKPNANLEQIVLSNLSGGQEFTKDDYVIILAGAHDDNIIKFQSALYNCISALKNTNVIYGEIRRNKYINKSKLNKLIETISLHIDNLYFSKLSFAKNNQLDRTNSCRWLILDIFLLDYKNHFTQNKDGRKEVENISTLYINEVKPSFQRETSSSSIHADPNPKTNFRS